MEKVYIHGNSSRGEEIIKLLESKGACNTLGLNGEDPEGIYFTINGMIDCASEYDNLRLLLITHQDYKELFLEETVYKFKPFDKVLVKNYEKDEWKVNFYGRYDSTNKMYPHICMMGNWKWCIPYEGNENKLGKILK